MKKIFVLSLLCLIIALLPATLTFAADDIRVILNGEQMAFEVNPIIKNGRTLVPMRAIFEGLGATVDWDGDTRTVTGAKGDITVKLVLGQMTATVNGEIIALDTPAEIVSGRTLVPLRFIAESLNAAVDWDGDTRTVTISAYDEMSMDEFFEYMDFMNQLNGAMKDYTDDFNEDDVWVEPEFVG
jgi:hypothetical protein